MANPLASSEIELSLELNPAAPAALQEVGLAYWELVGLDPETGDPVWARRTSDLNHGAWSGTPGYAAAAAVTVTAVGHVCAACGGPLTLSSRQAITDARRGMGVKCRACNATVDRQAVRILTPESVERRARQAAAAEARERAARCARELEQGRREAIAARYPVETADAATLIDAAPLLAKVGALAVLHGVGDKGGLVYPVDFESATVGPNQSLSRDLFLAAWRAGLLQIHPSSPSDAFTWESETTVGDEVYVDRARFFCPGDGELKQRLEDFAGYLRTRLSLENIAPGERADLVHLAKRIITEEGGRYFTYKLREHRLPDLADTHEEALRTAASRGASLFAIGHLYRMAWSSARDASSAHQRHAGMSREKAVVHGLNQFERWVQRACDDPGTLGGPYREEKESLPLSAVTGVVFRTILGLDPMSATPAEIVEILGCSPDVELHCTCSADIPERHELMEWIRTSSGEWGGEDFRQALAILEGFEPDTCAPHCAHEGVGVVAGDCGRIYDRIVSRVGEMGAAIVTAEATVIANRLQDGRARTGDALLAEVVRLLQAPRASEAVLALAYNED